MRRRTYIGFATAVVLVVVAAASGAVTTGKEPPRAERDQHLASGAPSNAISNYSIRIVRRYRVAIITAKLLRGARVGILVSRGSTSRGSARLRFVGRVPFGEVGRKVDKSWDLHLNDGTLLPKGRYDVTLRIVSRDGNVLASPSPFTSSCLSSRSM